MDAVLVVADASTAVSEAVLPLQIPTSSRSLDPESGANEAAACNSLLPAIRHHASSISAWLRLLASLPLPSSTVVAVAFTKVLLSPVPLNLPASDVSFELPQVDLLPSHVFLELLPPLLQLPSDSSSVSLFATSAKANSQVTSLLYSSSMISHTSQVHRVFHDVAAIVLRRRQTVPLSPPAALSTVGLQGSSNSKTPLATALGRACTPPRHHMHDVSGELNSASSFHKDGDADGMTAFWNCHCGRYQNHDLHWLQST
jgi:hypothetical protein